MKANDQILERMKSHNTLLCCGLDPDMKKMPFEIIGKQTSDEDKMFEFLRVVVDVTASHVCAYKAQKAFFDVLAGGHDVLKKNNWLHSRIISRYTCHCGLQDWRYRKHDGGVYSKSVLFTPSRRHRHQSLHG